MTMMNYSLKYRMIAMTMAVLMLPWSSLNNVHINWGKHVSSDYTDGEIASNTDAMTNTTDYDVNTYPTNDSEIDTQIDAILDKYNKNKIQNSEAASDDKAPVKASEIPYTSDRITVTEGFKLDRDIKIDGHYVLETGDLDLNGHVLEIEGDFIHSAGTVDVNSGKLIIHGNYQMQKGAFKNNGTVAFSASESTLVMNHTEDSISIDKDFIVNTNKNNSDKTLITEGEIKIGGNLSIYTMNKFSGFAPNGNNTIIMESDKTQVISGFDNRSKLNNLTINNTSDKGVIFEQLVGVAGKITVGESLLSGPLYAYTTTDFDLDYYNGDITFVDAGFFKKDFTVNGNLTISRTDYGAVSNYALVVKGDFINNGIITINNTFTVEGNINNQGSIFVYTLLCNGDMTNNGSVRLYRNSKVDGNVISDNTGSITLNDSNAIQFEIGGDCINNWFTMNNTKHHVIIDGNYSCTGKVGSYNLAKGKLELKGDVDLIVLYAGEYFNVVLSGDKAQTIKNANKLNIGILTLNNTSDEGIFADGIIPYKKVNSNISCNINYGGISGKSGWTLYQDEYIEGDLVLADGILNLNGHKLHVSGDLVQMSGNIEVGTGQLIIDGSYRMQQMKRNDETGDIEYSIGNATLTMSLSGGIVDVEKDFIVGTKANNFRKLSGGELHVGGDFEICEGSSENAFDCINNFELVLDGESNQNVSVPSGRTLTLAKYVILTKGKVQTNCDVKVITSLSSTTATIYEGLVILDSSYTKLYGGGFKGNMRIASHSFDSDYEIWGDLTITENISFLRNSIKLYVNGNVYSSGKINVNNNVTIDGNYYGTRNEKTYGGGIYISSGNLEIKGNADFSGGDSIYFQNYFSEAKVSGDFKCYNSPGSYSRGRLYVGGEFDVVNFHTSGSNEVIFNGEKKQTLNIDSSSRLENVTIQNYSDEGVVSNTVFNKTKLTVLDNCKFRYEGLDGVVGYKLTKDETLEELVLIDGVMDLSGHTLTVENDLVLMGGSLKVNGGKLIVKGNLRLQSRSGEKNNYTYDKSVASLMMSNSNDVVEVKKNMYNNCSKDNSTLWTDGKIILHGDYIVGSDCNEKSLYPTGNAQFILTDNDHSIIGEKSYISTISFNRLTIDTNTDEIDSPIISGVDIVIGDYIDAADAIFKNRITLKSYSAKIIGDTFNGNVCFKTNSIQGTYDKNGKLNKNAIFTINGDASGSVNVFSEIKINGNANFSQLIIQDAKLTVSQNLSVSTLYLENDNSYVISKGDFYCNQTRNGTDKLDKGTIEVKGNVELGEYFKASDNNKIILSGNKLQTVKTHYYSDTAIIELNNRSSKGVLCKGLLNYDSIEKNDSILSYDYGKYIEGGVLDKDATYVGDYYFLDGELDLNGHTLTIDGNFNHINGIIRINGGKLVVKKNYTIENKANVNHNHFRLLMNDDVLDVDGNIDVKYTRALDDIVSGKIYVGGDFSCSYYNNIKNNSIELIFDGDGDQIFNNCYDEIANLSINTAGKFTTKGRTIYVTNKLSSDCDENTVSISVPSLSVVKDGYKGDIVLVNDDILNDDITINGKLTLNHNLEINGHRLNIDTLETSNSGGIKMYNDADYIGVSKLLKIKGMDTELVAGTIELYGDLDLSIVSKLNSGKAHRLIVYKDTNRTQTLTGPRTIKNDNKLNELLIKGHKTEFKLNTEPEKYAKKVVFEFDDREIVPVYNLKADNIESSKVKIIFDDAEDTPASNYHIYRDNEFIAVTSQRYFVDSKLLPETTYEYKIVSYNKYGKHSLDSETLSVTTAEDKIPPSTPQGFNVDLRTGKSITLSWNKSTDDIAVEGYRLFRNDVEIYSGKDTKYRDVNVVTDTIYNYYVVAYDYSKNPSMDSEIITTLIGNPEIYRVEPAENSNISSKNAKITVYFRNYGINAKDKFSIKYYSLSNNKWYEVDSSDIKIVNIDDKRKSCTFTIDVEDLHDRSIRVSIKLIDSDGAEYEYEEFDYYIDNNPPDPVIIEEINDYNGVIKLKWDRSKSSDVDYYKVYRCICDENGNNTYSFIGKTESIEDITYADNSLAENTKARYVVSAIDYNGNESRLLYPSDIITVQHDNLCPEVSGINPKTKKISGQVELSVSAKDKKSVDGIKLYYKTADEDDSSDWVELAYAKSDKESSNVIVNYVFDTTSLPDGDYKINAVAIDSSNNKSENEYTQRYQIDNTGISKVNINKYKSGANYVQLFWDDVTEDDFAYFSVEIEGENGSFSEIQRVYDYTGCTIDNLIPEKEYSFRVVAVDDCGNIGEYSDKTTIITKEDDIGPAITSIRPVPSKVNGKLMLEIDANDNCNLGYAVWSYSFSKDSEIREEDESKLDAFDVSMSDDFTHIATVEGNGGSFTYSYVFDISDNKKFPDGKTIYIKSECYDAAGNKNHTQSDGGEIIATYIIDKKPPVVPTGFEAVPEEGYIQLNWDVNTEDDIAYYTIYKSDKNHVFKKIADTENSNYFDLDVEGGCEYSYKIRCVDIAGNISDETEPICETARVDNTNPEIKGISPRPSTNDEQEDLSKIPCKIGPSTYISCFVTDNSTVDKLVVYYKSLTSTEGWNVIYNNSLVDNRYEKTNYYNYQFVPDMSECESGIYQFKFVAYDKAGNQSGEVVRAFELDNTPCEGELVAEEDNFKINLSIGPVGFSKDGKTNLGIAAINDNDSFFTDFSYYEIYRCEVEDAPTKFMFFKNAKCIDKSSAFEYSDETVVPGEFYWYAAKIYDHYGNVSWTDPQLQKANNLDLIPPEINTADKITALTDYDFVLSAGASRDNVRIRDYKWIFEDGTVLKGSKVEHRINNPGLYNVKLVVTDTSDNFSEKDITILVKDRDNNGLCKVRVTDEKGCPIPYANVFINASEDENRFFMTDGSGEVQLAYKAGEYKVAAYKEGYLPSEIDVKINASDTSEYSISLDTGEVVVGKFEIQRMSLQEMIDEDVDMSDPANLNTFVFKTTLLFEKGTLPICVVEYPGDMCIVTNADTVKPGKGTGSSSGNGGGGQGDPIAVSRLEINAPYALPGIPEMPVYAVLSTTQTVSWMKTMYNAKLTILNAAESKYVIEDAKGSIELPEGVSLAVLGDDKKALTGTKTGQTEIIDMGDIKGQDQKTVNWILKGDKSGTYKIKAHFNGILTPFNVPVKKDFVAETAMEVDKANVEIVVMPEASAFIGESYYINYSIRNCGTEPLYNFKTTIGDYKKTKDVTEIFVMDYKTEKILYSEKFESGCDYKLPIGSQIFQTPVLKGNDTITIPTLMPGQTIYGTWTLKDEIFLGDYQREYYKLVKYMSEVIEGQDLGVSVFIKPIPSHVTKYITTEWHGKDEVVEIGDPIDLSTGAFTDTVTTLGLQGKDNLSFDIHYDSIFAADESKTVNTCGNGWYTDFDSWIEEKNGVVHYYMNPYVCIPFISESSYNRKITRDENAEGFQISNVTIDKDITFVSTLSGIEDIKLIRHVDGSYTLYVKDGATLEYNSYGRLCRYISEEGSVSDITYDDLASIGDATISTDYEISSIGDAIASDGDAVASSGDALASAGDASNIKRGYLSDKTEYTQTITERITGNTINIHRNKEGRILSASDHTGRITSLGYDAQGNLETITNPLNETLSYNYDDKHLMTKSLDNDGGLIVENSYDVEGRVIKQKDAIGTELNISYEETEERGVKAKVSHSHDGVVDHSEAIFNEHGYILSVTDESGSVSYQYNENDDIIRYDNSCGEWYSYKYDSEGNITGFNSSFGESYNIAYDKYGNITKLSSGEINKQSDPYKESTFVYDEEGKLISGETHNITINYSYDENGQLKSMDTEGRGTCYFNTVNGRVTSYLDESGAEYSFAYDEYGNVCEKRNPAGSVEKYTYDAMGRLIIYENSRGGQTKYTYNSLGYITSETDPLGNTCNYSYDIAGRPISIKYPDGSEIQLKYDMLGHLVEKVFADNTSEKYTYDVMGNVTSITYADGMVETIGYNDKRMISQVTDVMGNTSNYIYDDKNQLKSIISASDNEYEMSYDDYGRMNLITTKNANYELKYNELGLITDEIDPIGNTKKYEYDKMGNCIASIDPNGNRIEYTYDNVGRCLSVTYPNGFKIDKTYDISGNVIEINTEVSGEKLSYRYIYDNAGFLTSSFDESGNETKYVYDKVGNLIKIQDSAGNYNAYCYDCMGRICEESDNFGNTVSYTYDVNGNLIHKTVSSVMSEMKDEYQYTYDDIGHLLKVQNPSGEVTSQVYDPMGRVTAVTDAMGGVTEYTYDKSGNLIEEKNTIGNVVKYSYDDNGNLTSVTDARGNVSYYTYDKCGRLIEYNDPAGTIKYTYDSNGNVLTVSDKKGVIKRSYDNMNRVSSCTDCNGNTITYGYDELGNILSITYPGGEIVRYAYNPDGTIAEMSDGSGRKTIYGYDKQGRLTSTTRADGSVESLTYDDRNNISVREDKNAAGETLQKYEYSYDNIGNIISIKESVKCEYSKNHIIDAESLNCKITYDNDTNNIKNVSLSMEYDKANRLIKYNGIDVLYDNDGNMIYGPLNGEMTEFQYDCRNRLISAGGVNYSYDAENVRVQSETSEYKEEYVTDRVYPLSRVLTIKRTDKIDKSYQVTTCYYGSGLAYDVSVGANDDLTAQVNSETRIYHFDHLGSTRYITDYSGSILMYFDYGTYGEFIGAHQNDGTKCDLSELNIPIKYLYNGEYGVITDDNNLLYMRQRYYNTEIKRFINQDILTGSILDNSSLNRYSYVEGNPISYLDPFGLSKFNARLNTVRSVLHSISGFVNSSDGVHALLDLYSSAPIVGGVFALINAGLYIKEHKPYEAAEAIVFSSPAINLIGGLAGNIGGKVFKGCKNAKNIVKSIFTIAGHGAGFLYAFNDTLLGIHELNNYDHKSGNELDYYCKVLNVVLSVNQLRDSGAGFLSEIDTLGRVLGNVEAPLGQVIDHFDYEEIEWDDPWLHEKISIDGYNIIKQNNVKPDFYVTCDGTVLPSDILKKDSLYDRLEYEVYSGRAVRPINAVDDWDDFLGPNQTNVDPRTGKIDNDRIWSSDGTRSIRFGDHEMHSSPNKLHYHKETWYDGYVINELQRVQPR